MVEKFRETQNYIHFYFRFFFLQLNLNLHCAPEKEKETTQSIRDLKKQKENETN